MTVVDRESGWEYDLVQGRARSRPGAGRSSSRWGGRTRLDGPGNGSGATASGFGNLAGIIRAPELARGRDPARSVHGDPVQLRHTVFPATGGAGSRLLADGRTPPRWARASSSRCRTLRSTRCGVPAWKKTILRAMARYGMYFGDTGSGGWGIQMESGATYTSFGLPDALRHLRELRRGVPAYGGDYVFDIGQRDRLALAAARHRSVRGARRLLIAASIRSATASHVNRSR